MEGPEVTTGSTRNRIRLVALILLCAGMLASGFLFSRKASGDHAFPLGLGLSLAIVVWAVFYAVLGRQAGRRAGAISFLAIFCSFFAGGFVGHLPQKGGPHRDIVDLFRREISALVDSAVHSRRSDILEAGRAMEELERYRKTVRDRSASLRSECDAEIAALGWETVLDPVRIARDKGLRESGLMVLSAKHIIDKYRRKNSDLLDRVREEIGGMDLSENQKQEVRKGFDEGLSKARAWTAALRDCDAGIVDEVDAIFKFLAHKQGTWAVEDGELIFDDEADLSTFDRHIERIRKWADKAEVIQRQGFGKFDGNPEKPKD